MPSADPSSNRTPRSKARTYDSARVGRALIGQVEAVAEAAHRLTAEQLRLPSGLRGWDVHHLLVHIALQTDAVPRLLAAPAPPADARRIGLSAWAVTTSARAAKTDEWTRGEAARTENGAARIDEAVAELEVVLEAAVSPDVLVPHDLGAMRVLDVTVTRLVELVVHGDDLARATGVPVTFDRQALATTVRVLADALAAKAPGGSVEVRVPPFAVVQCVEGPRHTRGTPPNVVETDPLTWIRLATGRLSWAAARESHAVSASGERADLTAQLPVLS